MATRWLLGDAFFHGADVDVGDPRIADTGDQFNLLSDGSGLTLLGLSDSAVFVYSASDYVSLVYPSGPASVSDLGSGLHLSVSESGNPSLQHMVSVLGFGADLTATLAVSAPAAWPSRPPPPSVVADGNGGSIVGGIVDLVGVAAPDPARLSSFRSYA